MYSYQPDTPQIPQINPVTGQLEPPPIDKDKEKEHFEEFYEVAIFLRPFHAIVSFYRLPFSFLNGATVHFLFCRICTLN